MLGLIHEKMATPESTLGGGKFFTSDSTIVRNDVLACNDLCAPIEDYSIVAGNGSWNNTHTSNSSNRGKRLGKEQSTLVQRAQRTGGSSRNWGPTPFKFPPHNVECKKGEG